MRQLRARRVLTLCESKRVIPCGLWLSIENYKVDYDEKNLSYSSKNEYKCFHVNTILYWYATCQLYFHSFLHSPNIWNGIDLAMCFTGHAYFLFITRPDCLNKRFPFHLRAGKVIIMDIIFLPFPLLLSVSSTSL